MSALLTAKCRHCARPIQPHMAWWLDDEGLYRCMKDVNHEPMPSGLDWSEVEEELHARKPYIQAHEVGEGER